MEKRLFWLVGAVLAAGYLVGVLGFPARHGRVINGDAKQYYAWLQSAVFDRDLDFSNQYQLLYGGDGASKNVWLTTKTPVGRLTNMMSAGPAILWSPFFLVTALILGAFRAEPLNGMEPALQASVGVAGVFYATLGGWLVYRTCALWFSRTASFWAAMTVWLAGSALYYTLVSPTYSHATSLFAVSLFVYVWQKGYQARNAEGTEAARAGDSTRTVVRRMLLLGALGGLAAMVRWQDVIVLLLPAAELLRDCARKRVSVVSVTAGCLALGAAALAAMSPQLFAWYAVYGSPVVMPQGAGFMRWTQPEVLNLLFSLRHGLFTWTPCFLLAVAGLPFLVRRDRFVGWTTIAMLALAVYVNAVVWDWWAGEAFGARRFIGYSAFFALGLAALLSRPPFKQRPGLVAAIGSAFVVYNVLFLLQYQVFMRGMRDLVPYPETAKQVFVDRLLLPFQLLARWLSS